LQSAAYKREFFLLMSMPQWGRREAWWGNLRERNHWGDQGVGGRIILGWIVRKWDVRVWTGLGWLRIETGGEQL
jgi:hypothetical protein